ncbi:unnamed protein product, partial [Ectocarpus fasciculatus]
RLPRVPRTRIASPLFLITAQKQKMATTRPHTNHHHITTHHTTRDRRKARRQSKTATSPTPSLSPTSTTSSTVRLEVSLLNGEKTKRSKIRLFSSLLQLPPL